MTRRELSELDEAIRPLKDQVRWLRHALERVLWIGGLTYGLAIAGLVTFIIR